MKWQLLVLLGKCRYGWESAGTHPIGMNATLAGGRTHSLCECLSTCTSKYTRTWVPNRAAVRHGGGFDTFRCFVPPIGSTFSPNVRVSCQSGWTYLSMSCPRARSPWVRGRMDGTVDGVVCGRCETRARSSGMPEPWSRYVPVAAKTLKTPHSTGLVEPRSSHGCPRAPVSHACPSSIGHRGPSVGLGWSGSTHTHTLPQKRARAKVARPSGRGEFDLYPHLVVRGLMDQLYALVRVSVRLEVEEGGVRGPSLVDQVSGDRYVQPPVALPDGPSSPD